MDRLARIEVFIRVTEDGGFSAAARSLGITQSSASKAISELEARLRTRLFNRTTRTISLTSSGSSYYKKMKRLISLLEEAEEEAGSEQKNFQGRLRINTSTITSEKLVIPALMGFKEKFPEIDIEITMDDRRIDLVNQPTDIAVRIGPLPDSTLRARRAGKALMGLFASPDYLDRTGPDTESLSDLSGHQMIQFSDRKTISLLVSLGATEGNSVDEISTSLTVSNVPLAKYAALAGSGLAILPHFFVVDEVRENRLVQIMPKLDLPSMEVSLVNPFSSIAPKRVTTFVDYAIDYWRKEGLLEV